MANNLSAQTRCYAGPLPVAQVSVCVCKCALGGRAHFLHQVLISGGLRLVANLERYSKSKTLENRRMNEIIWILLMLAIHFASVMIVKIPICKQPHIQVKHATQEKELPYKVFN